MAGPQSVYGLVSPFVAQIRSSECAISAVFSIMLFFGLFSRGKVRAAMRLGIACSRRGAESGQTL